jgi:sigma-B regulation protein RsbU (phosphoserine phosphatase)
MSVPSPAAPLQPEPQSKQPILVIEQAGQKTQFTISHVPYTVGRKSDKDLVIADPRVSRDHAQIELVGTEYWISDQNSRHGTFVNGEKVERHKLKKNDRLEFGARDGAVVFFDPEEAGAASSNGEWLKDVVELETSGASDLEKLSLFLDAVRKLNNTSVLDEVLVTLLDATLKLTHAERGFVFMRSKEGMLKLAAGRDARGNPLTDGSTISQSILQEAVTTACEFLVTDTSRSDEISIRNSIVAFDLRTVICIPLCKTSMKQTGVKAALPGTTLNRQVLGALYLDSHFASRDVSAISHDALRAIATEAAALVENAHLVEAEEESRKYQQELAIAASIQQGLMAPSIPEVPYAKIRARSVACKEIGGDFYDAVKTDSGLTVIVADVCGKGISAALLASTLQGMIFSQLEARVPLKAIAKSVNEFFCQKRLGEKYATLFMAQLKPDGSLEFINCGHVPPVLVSEGKARRPSEGNLPVGLMSGAMYESAQCHMKQGDRMIIITDGVTEAANAEDDFYGDDRLEAVALVEDPFNGIVKGVAEFCAETPLNDDCTVLELSYSG